MGQGFLDKVLPYYLDYRRSDSTVTRDSEAQKNMGLIYGHKKGETHEEDTEPSHTGYVH